MRNLPTATLLPVAAALATALLLAPGAVRAQELEGVAALYVWLPALDGETTHVTSGRSVETSISRGNLLKAFEFGMMGAAEVHYGRFALLHDTVYTSLNSDGTAGPAQRVSVDVDTKLLLTTTALGYRAYDEAGALVEPFAGVRYVWVDSEAKAQHDVRSNLAVGASLDAHWWDPVIGVRGRLPLSETWTIGGVFDIGGFGAGSDFTWQAFAGVEYAISERTTANLGFRYLSIRYSADRVDVDLRQYGPLLGLAMRF